MQTNNLSKYIKVISNLFQNFKTFKDLYLQILTFSLETIQIRKYILKKNFTIQLFFQKKKLRIIFYLRNLKAFVMKSAHILGYIYQLYVTTFNKTKGKKLKLKKRS